jgi:hypothetical protein
MSVERKSWKIAGLQKRVGEKERRGPGAKFYLVGPPASSVVNSSGSDESELFNSHTEVNSTFAIVGVGKAEAGHLSLAKISTSRRGEEVDNSFGCVWSGLVVMAVLVIFTFTSKLSAPAHPHLRIYSCWSDVAGYEEIHTISIGSV